MCSTVPALVLARDGDTVVVELHGGPRRLSALLVPELAPGDHCLVGLGTVLARLTDDEATDLATELRAVRTGADDWLPRQDPGRV